MKKVLGVAAIAVLGVVALASCKKDYTCSVTIDGVTASADYPGLSKSEAAATETTCKAGGGTWSAK